MKFDIEQHFEKRSPPQSEMAEEACKRKPPWGLPGEGQGDQVNHWKVAPKSTDEETNGTTSSSNGTSSVTNGVSCSDTSCENSVDNCSSSQGKTDLRGVCVNGVETKSVDVPPTLENIQGIKSESSLDEIPQLQREAASDDVSSDYPDPPDITGDCKDPLEASSPTVPHSDVLPPDLCAQSKTLQRSESDSSHENSEPVSTNHSDAGCSNSAPVQHSQVERKDQECVASKSSDECGNDTAVRHSISESECMTQTVSENTESSNKDSVSHNIAVSESMEQSSEVSDRSIESSKNDSVSTNPNDSKTESIEQKNDKSNTDCSKVTENIGAERKELESEVSEINTECSDHVSNEAETVGKEQKNDKETETPQVVTPKSVNDKSDHINTEYSKGTPELLTEMQHCEASEEDQDTVKQQRKDPSTKEELVDDKHRISESDDEIESSLVVRQSTEAAEKCDVSDSESSETKQESAENVSESSGTKQEAAENVSESSETKQEAADTCDVPEDKEQKEDKESGSNDAAEESFAEDLDVTLEGIEGDDLPDAEQSATPSKSKDAAGKITRPCSVDLDTHEITRYLSTHKRRRKWGRPKTKVDKKEDKKTEKEEESAEKKEEKKKSPVKVKKPRKPKVVTRTITTRHNPKVSEPEIPPPMLNNRVRLELRRLQLDPLPEKREDSPSPEPPKPKKKGRWAQHTPKQAEVKIKEEPKEKTPEPEIVPKKLGRPKKIIETSKKEPMKKQGGVKKPKVHHKKTFLNLLKKLQKIEMRQKKLGKSLVSPKQIKLKGELKKSPKLNKSISKDKTPTKSKSPTKEQSPQSDESGKKKLGRPPKFLSTSTPKKDISPESTKKRKVVRKLKDSPKRRKTDSESAESSSIIKECQIKLENPVTEMLNSTRCNFCKKIFTSKNKYYIRRHLASVHGLEPFCKRCSTIFNNKQELLDHAQGCDAKHNNQNKRLLAHLMRAKKRIKIIEEETDGVNAIPCPYCNKMINHKQNLRRHLQSYHPELEDNSVCYTCPYCHKIVANKYNLQRHMTVLHRDEAFCKFCWELFNSFPELKVHLGKCKNGPHFDKKRKKWECPWESKSITQNLLKFEVPATEETIAEAESSDCPIEHEMIEETILYGSVQNNEVDCDNSEFFTQEESTDISFVISEVVEIFTTDDDTSDLSQVLACENVISIPPESITHEKGVVSVNLQKGIRIVNGENWDSSREECDSATTVVTAAADVASVVDLESLPILTLRNSNVATDFHRESGSHDEDDRIYQVL
ncbi:hypothetical protein B566_EDAN009811 [Ephemera danica]|nr:hypothetical protein B566_EDAN009811 [Ephemera danica]